jgi:hypothetical protein
MFTRRFSAPRIGVGYSLSPEICGSFYRAIEAGGNGTRWGKSTKYVEERAHLG